MVFNKIDLLTELELAAFRTKVLQAIDWQGPVFAVASLQRQGTQALCYALMERLESMHAAEIKALEASASVSALESSAEALSEWEDDYL